MSWLKGTTFAGVCSALFVGAFTFAASEHLFYGTVNGKYFFLLSFVTLLALWFSYKVVTGDHSMSYRGRWLLGLSVLMLGVSYISGILGVFPERSFFSELLRSTGLFYLTYVGLLACLLSELLNERDWTLVRRTIAISSAFFAFFTLLGAQGFDLSGKFLTVNLGNTAITLGSETFGGIYLLIAFAVTLIEFFRSAQIKQYLLWGGLLLVQFLSPLLFNTVAFLHDPLGSLSNPLSLVGTARSSSVAAVLLIGYLAGVFAIYRWGSARLKKYFYAGWAGIWFVGVITLVVLLLMPGSVVQDRYIQESSAARVIVWNSGIEAFKDRPILGWGPENFRLAFSPHFDNRLYLNENLGEIWFDRAHNVLIETLVSVGLLGLILHMLVAMYIVPVVMRAVRQGLITSLEAHVLGALVVAHILQLQTGFDTVGTYGLLGVVMGYVLWLERQTTLSPIVLSKPIRHFVSGLLVLFMLALSVPALFGEYRQQKATYKIFVTPNALQQEGYIKGALTQQSDFEAFRLAQASLIKGLFSQIAEKAIDEKRLEAAMRQLGLYEVFMRTYVAEHPEDYRVRINFAYLLLTITALGGEDKIVEAKEVIAGSYAFSPENPLTHVLAATAELYSGNIAVARQKIAEGVALNPDIEFTQEIAQYIEKQAVQFPNITVLKLENL